MKYIKNFFNFWRKFIVGDDSSIFVMIVWSLVVCIALTKLYLNLWIIMPICVVTVLGYSVYSEISVRARSNASGVGVVKYDISTYVPAILSYLVPLIWFRAFVSSVSFTSVVLIELIQFVIIILILAMTLHKAYLRWPNLVVCVFALVTLLNIL